VGRATIRPNGRGEPIEDLNREGQLHSTVGDAPPPEPFAVLEADDGVFERPPIGVRLAERGVKVLLGVRRRSGVGVGTV
jgi:hypothetical protein